MKHRRYCVLLAISVCMVACFLFYRIAYPYHLLHREQMLLFVYTREQFLEYWTHPASLASLAGDFLTQFLCFRTLGAGLLVMLLTLMGILSYIVCRKWTGRCWAWAVSVGLFVYEAAKLCNLHYPLAGTVAIIGSLVLFLVVDRRKRLWAFGGFALVCTFLCYYLFGNGVLVFAVLLLLSCKKAQKRILPACLTGVFAFVLPVWGTRWYLIPDGQAYCMPVNCWYGIPDFEEERLLGLDMEYELENWDRFNRLVAECTLSHTVAVFYHLAGAAQGRLPESLMDHHQGAALGLFMPVDEKSTYFSTQLAGEVWFRLGDMTMAEHAFLLGMIFSPRNKNVRMVKRLAEINMINGDTEAARRYLRMLSKTLFYESWADERIPGKESETVRRWLEAKRSDLPRRDTLRLSSTDVVKSLHLLLEANPQNRIARDYLLCFDLLMKDLTAFSKDYKAYHTGRPNRLYAEALMICLYREKATGEKVRATGMSPDVVREFNEYNRLREYARGDGTVLSDRFGKTYWYYYQFINR